MAEPSLERDNYEPDHEGSGEPPKKPGGLLSFLSELPVLILTAIVIAWLIKTFLVQPFYIPSSSMEPTLLPGDRVLVSKIDYRFSDPKVDQIIVFQAPEMGDLTQPEDFIKRIVAVEGMQVQVREGKLIVDGEPRREPFVRPDRRSSRFGPLPVPEDSVFVMGDNRANSKDSRIFGPVEETDIVGKAFVIYWPPDRAGMLR